MLSEPAFLQIRINPALKVANLIPLERDGVAVASVARMPALLRALLNALLHTHAATSASILTEHAGQMP